MTGSNPTLAPYAKTDGVHLRITVKAHDATSAAPLIASLEEEVRSRLGEAIYTDETTWPDDFNKDDPRHGMRRVAWTLEAYQLQEQGQIERGRLPQEAVVMEEISVEEDES